MAGVIATIPKFQFSNAAGVVMSGGTLTSYLAGTTTPVTTYQDSALTIANTNPINLDSRGECLLWLDSTKTYKFVLKNALGVIQWTVDNITGAGALADRLRTDLAASSGSALSGYIASGIGAVASTVRDKLRQTVSILDYGVNTIPGTTDMTAAFNAAIASGAKRIDTCGQNYFLSAAPTLQNGQEIFGGGTVNRGINTVGNNRISGINFIFSSSAILGPSIVGSNITIDNCYFSGGTQVLLLNICDNVRIYGNHFTGAIYGIIQALNKMCSNITIVGNTFKSMTNDCILFNTNDSVTIPYNIAIVGNVCDTVGPWPTVATESRFAGGTAVRDLLIADNVVRRTSGDSACHFELIQGMFSITGNMFEDCIAASGKCIFITNLTTTPKGVISGNTFVTTEASYNIGGEAFIHIGNASSLSSRLITGNIFESQTTTAKWGIGINAGFNFGTSIQGNHFIGLTTGIACDGAQNIQGQNNYFYNTTLGVKCVNAVYQIDGNFDGNTFVDCATAFSDANALTFGSNTYSARNCVFKGNTAAGTTSFDKLYAGMRAGSKLVGAATGGVLSKTISAVASATPTTLITLPQAGKSFILTLWVEINGAGNRYTQYTYSFNGRLGTGGAFALLSSYTEGATPPTNVMSIDASNNIIATPTGASAVNLKFKITDQGTEF